MSNNHFYKDFCGSTFQNDSVPPMFVPPPPMPPPQLLVPVTTQMTSCDVHDQNYIKTFENRIPEVAIEKSKPKLISISHVREKLRDVVLSLNELKRQESVLADKAKTCSEEEWKEIIEEIERNKMLINELLSKVNTSYLDTLKKLIAKRSAKRLRLKRLRLEKKRAKEDRIKDMQEKSRKIDEDLQKIKDAITKAKQEEESKLQADVVLKEVQRKKHNAKKFIAKLDALKKLRHARVNTARGRGADVSKKDCEVFEEKIEKLKLLWAQKLIVYEKEEEDLRATLEQDSDAKNADVNEMEKQVASNLKKWRKVLFGEGGASPQADFNGDVARFVAVRCQWDQFVSDSGSSLPIGWVTPSVSSQEIG